MQVPKLRFKEFNNDWKEKKLNNFLTESQIKGTNGKTAKKLSVKLWAKGVVEKKEILEGSMETQYYTRHSGQLIYGKLDFLNCAFGIIPKELDGYQSTADVPAFDIKNINSKFLLNKIIQKNFYQKYGDIADGTRKAKRIHTDTFLNMSIYLPSLEEQTKISNFLSLIDRKIELQEKLVENLKLYKKGLLQKVFSNNHGWKSAKLGDLFEISASGDISKDRVSNVKTNTFKYPVYSNSLIDNGLFGYTDTYKIDGNTITVTGRGDIGFAIPRFEKYYPIVRLLVLKSNNMNNVFFANLINYTKIIVESTGVPQLTAPQLKSVLVKYPSIEEQNRIANLFSNLDKKIDFETNRLTKLKKYKKGLLQQMFI